MPTLDQGDRLLGKTCPLPELTLCQAQSAPKLTKDSADLDLPHPPMIAIGAYLPVTSDAEFQSIAVPRVPTGVVLTSGWKVWLRRRLAAGLGLSVGEGSRRAAGRPASTYHSPG